MKFHHAMVDFHIKETKIPGHPLCLASLMGVRIFLYFAA
jgi:hypothetical protein